MLLTVYTLPQLAVSAKLLCLLMVVICGAVPPMVRSVRLYNECSHSSVRVGFDGKVNASSDFDDDDPFQNLTLRSHGFGPISIQAVASSRFICFNKRWKLVGVPMKKAHGAMCQFVEEMTPSGYLRYQSSADKRRYMGFNKHGPINRELASQKLHRRKCFDFLKKDSDFNINDHNSKISGGNNEQPVAPPSTRPGDVGVGGVGVGVRLSANHASKVAGKSEPTGKVRLRHNHGGRRKSMSKKPS